MPIERRNQSALGRKRRLEFDRSLHRLRALGMPEWAVEYYRRAARVAGLPPHMVVCHVAVVAAGRQLQGARSEPNAARQASGEPAVPTPTSVRAMEQRVTNLWREIERHGSLLDTAAQAADNGSAEAAAATLAAKITLLQGGAQPARNAALPRRRRPSAKEH